jgi:DNA-binding NarL/FixJ family response regulator
MTVMTTDHIAILLVDDQAMIRSGLALVLGAEPDFIVVAECDDGDGVPAALRSRQPDVVLMDVRMPRVTGPEAIRRMREAGSSTPVLALTTFDDDKTLWSALDAGAAGFVLKDSAPESLVEAVRVVAAGGAWLDPRVLPRVIERARTRRSSGADPRLLDRLTPRELDVLRQICRGDNNAEIAAVLRMGERTVKSHVSALFLKLQVRDRAVLIVTALDLGINRT